MENKMRVQLLRDRLNAVRGYALPAWPKAKAARREIHPSHFRNFIHLAVGQHVREMPKQWVARADAKPKVAVNALRKARKSPLIAIAEKQPRKLLRSDVGRDGDLDRCLWRINRRKL